MAQFDFCLWTKKAHSRKRETLLCGLAAVDGLRSTVSWAKRRGFNVEFQLCSGEHGLCSYQTKQIIIDPRMALETQLYVLLHECGHALIDSSQQLQKDWPRGYSAVENGFVPRGYRHKIAVLAEEIEAWNRGHRLASRLNVSINEEAFNKIRDKLLKSHIESAT